MRVCVCYAYCHFIQSSSTIAISRHPSCNFD